MKIELEPVEEEALAELARELAVEPEVLARTQVRLLLDASYLAGLDELLLMGDPIDRDWVARHQRGTVGEWLEDRIRRRFGFTALRKRVRELRSRLDADMVAAGFLVRLEAAGVFVGDMIRAAEADEGSKAAAKRPRLRIAPSDAHYCSACRQQIERKEHP